MRRDHSAPDTLAESAPPNQESDVLANEGMSSDRPDRHSGMEPRPPEFSFAYCPFYHPPKLGQPLSYNTKSLYWLAERFFTNMRESGITIRLHPNDIDRLVGRVLASKPLVQ